MQCWPPKAARPSPQNILNDTVTHLTSHCCTIASRLKRIVLDCNILGIFQGPEKGCQRFCWQSESLSGLARCWMFPCVPMALQVTYYEVNANADKAQLRDSENQQMNDDVLDVAGRVSSKVQYSEHLEGE